MAACQSPITPKPNTWLANGAAEYKSEYYRGEIFAMAGATESTT